jgi:hypothetical protein
MDSKTTPNHESHAPADRQDIEFSEEVMGFFENS